MRTPEEQASDLQLVIESERSPLQTPLPGRRGLLAAVYPHARKIVLFEKNIAARCHEKNLSLAEQRDRLILHEIAHYKDWLECRRQRRRWNPRNWKDELRIRRRS